MLLKLNLIYYKMNLPINFTIKQTELIKELIKDGYKLVKYDGKQLAVFKKGIAEVEICNY